MAHRLAIVVSHPIQYFTYLYRGLAQRPDIDLRVFFCSRIGLDSYFDREMGQEIRWAGDLTEGYDHVFLPEAPSIRQTGFRSVDNPSIGSALDDFKPDAVWVHGYSQLTALRTLWWAARHHVPSLMVTDSNAGAPRGWVKKHLRATVLGLLLPRISGFLTCGDRNEAALAELGISHARMFRAPFPIEEPRYEAAFADRDALRGTIRRQLNIAENAFVGITVGKLIERKGADKAMSAIADLNRTQPAHLIICGNGPMMDALKRQAAATAAPVSFAGFINSDVLPPYYAAADSLIHPASHEPKGLICSEAAAMGLPQILSSAVGSVGPTDVARPGENCIVVPPDDQPALDAAVRRLATDAGLQAEMAVAARRIYAETDTAHAVAGAHAAVAAVCSKATRPFDKSQGKNR